MILPRQAKSAQLRFLLLALLFPDLVRGITSPLFYLHRCRPFEALRRMLTALSFRHCFEPETSSLGPHLFRGTSLPFRSLGPNRDSYSLPKLGTLDRTLHTYGTVCLNSPLFLAISGGADACIHVCEPRRRSSYHRSRCEFNVAHCLHSPLDSDAM